jgi:NAD(P)-dependent dehydrogenase (short-subunit alcohol dehydrogenase family)
VVIIPVRGVAAAEAAVSSVVRPRGGGAGARRALVIAGAGMLSACASALVADGWHVVLPSRRYAPIPTLVATAGAGRALWVAADVSNPDDLARRAAKALGGPVELLVAWLRREHRQAVLAAVEPLLTPDCPVVEVHGSAAADPVGGCPDPVLGHHPTQQVVLGFMPVGQTSRRLSHEEISAGVLAAVDRALTGKPSGVYQVGQPRPWRFTAAHRPGGSPILST